MANEATSCQYETERPLEPPQLSTDHDDDLYYSDFDCSLSVSDFRLDDIAFDCEENSLSSTINDLLCSELPQESKEITDTLKPPIIISDVKGPKKEKVLKNKRNIKKGQRYLPSFKRKVLNYAVKHSFRETASKFQINCNTLTEWAREYKRLLLLKKSTTARPGLSQKTDSPGKLLKTEQTEPQTEKFLTTDEKRDNNGDIDFLHWLKKKRLEGRRLGRIEVQTTGLTFLRARQEKITDWFNSWVERLIDESKEVDENNRKERKPEKHISYPHSFKIEVALYGKMYTKKEAAQTFGVSSRRVYEWCDRLNTPKADSARTQIEEELLTWYHQKCGDGCRPKCLEIMSKARILYAEYGLPHVKCSQGWLDKVRKRLDLKLSHVGDDDLLVWVLAQLDNNASISLLQVTTKAQELARDKGDKTFKGSKGWTLRFLKRNSHLLQCSSAQLSDLPPSARAQARSFCLSLQQRVGAASLEDSSVGCMDEVPISFVYPTDTVSSPPLLRKTTLEKCHAVVLLSTTSDGRLLPPAVVLKGARTTQTFKSDSISLLVLRQDTGTVDKEVIQDWARHVWLPSVRVPSVLIVDSFAPHTNENLKEELSSGYCHLAIIPPGCAIHLQPCSVDLTRRFQEAIQEQWIKYATSASAPSKNGPNEDAILNWVVQTYLILREDKYSIRCSFDAAGITKSAD